MSPEQENGSKEEEALLQEANRYLEKINIERAGIAASLEGLGAEERANYQRYLSEVDPELLELAREVEVLYQLESVLDKVEWELAERLFEPNSKQAFSEVVRTAEEFGERFSSLPPTNQVFFKHIISEVRCSILISRAQSGEEPTAGLSKRMEELLRTDEISGEVDQDSAAYREEKLRKVILLSQQGVNPLIAARRAAVELKREAAEKAERLKATYRTIVEKILGLKDGKLPV